MFPLLKILFTLATSKRGRKVLRRLFVYLNSDEGQRMLARARKVATGPEAQRLARQVARLLGDAAERTRVARRGGQAQTRGRLGTFATSGRRAGANAAGRAWQRARSARSR
jgi:hypothetical protein